MITYKERTITIHDMKEVTLELLLSKERERDENR